MDLSILLQLPEELLFLWHAHRTEIFLSAGLLFAAVRLAVHWRQSRSKTALTPPLGTPVDEKPLEISAVPAKLAFAEADHVDPTPTPVVKPKTGPKRVTGVKRSKSSPQGALPKETPAEIQPLIFYYSLGGSTKAHAESLAQALQREEPTILTPALHDLTETDYDDYFTAPPKSSCNTAYFYLLLVPSYDIDNDLDVFLEHLKETHHDFRIDTAPLSTLAGYAVFGLGDKHDWPTEREGFCKDAVQVDKWMARLTGKKRGFPLGMGDSRTDAERRLGEWRRGVEGCMGELARGNGLGEGIAGSGEAMESDDEEDVDDEDNQAKTRRPKPKQSKTADLEDIKPPVPVDFTTTGKSKPAPTGPKPMVATTSPTYAALTKQGYTIVGSHSGVKTCRWTKSALRGRGSCYKYSFYGIASHLCMEATPSLSCSNKCVFCWRHGTNPVGTTWRWQVDPADQVFGGMKAGHYQKIKMLKGVPGVRAERFSEALRIRHCALSLVGEPIFYPHINALLALLHAERISTFLVCNAQHPDHLAALDPVTQLYVSIDASDPDSLRKIDRPLHRDYWQRFTRCLDILKTRRYEQRTVFRLTLVKGFNIDTEAEGYANLVERALPAFVEVKGVTFCGTSTAAGAGLSMQNVPFYDEVAAFVLALERALAARGLDYGIAAEHKHSCCILLADRERFFRVPEVVEGDPAGEGEDKRRWHSLISYEKFFNCLESGNAFSPEDYIGAPTPEWALWGNGGFDPRDTRVDRKGRAVEEVK